MNSNNLPNFLLFYLMATWGIIVTLYWMYVGWRAMLAHERLATAVEDIAEPRRPHGE